MLHLVLSNIVLTTILIIGAHACGHTLWPFETWHQFSVMTLSIVGGVMLTIMLYRCKVWLCLMYAVLAVLAIFVGYFATVYAAAAAMGY